MSFLVQPRQTIVFTGDSITDCGRRGPGAPLGDGYVRMIADLIVAKYPDHNLNVINTGISGHTVRDLSQRWTDDVVRFQPHWLSIMIGINDIHRWLANVQGASVTAQEYAELYDAILARTVKETDAKIILIDPFYISTDKAPDSGRAKVLKHLPSYIKTVHKMAKKYKTRHVKLHDAFARQLKRHSPDRFCPEPVHPSPSGHLLMAQQWLAEVNF